MATNNQEQTKATINFVADVLKKSPNPALREASKQMRAQSNLSDAITLAEEAATSTNPNNSLVGNLAVLVGEQWVETQSADIYGNIFKLGGTFDTAGTYITVRPNNIVGQSTPTNYQTSTDALSSIAWGKSVTNGEWLSFQVINTPLYNYTSTSGTLPFCTFNLTVPDTFASFSSLSPMKANEIIAAWRGMVEDENKIYFNSLGNMLFTDFLPKNRYTATSTNLYACLQFLILPVIEGLKQATARFNAGINYTPSLASGTTDETYIQNLFAITTSTLQGLTPYTSLPSWEIFQNSTTTNNVPYLNISKANDYVIYMNPYTASAFVTLLQTSAIGKNTIDIQTSGNVVTSIGGVPVQITGTLLQPTQQAAQGSPNTVTFDTGQALANGQVVIINKDYLTWYKYYDKMYETDTFINAMVKIIRDQKAYVPVLKPWLNGIVLDISTALDSANTLQVSTDA